MGSSDRRNLYFVDLDAGTSRLVTSDVLGAVRVAEDHSFAIFVDGSGHMQGVSGDGMMVVPLAYTALIADLRMLSGKRFIYRTTQRELKVGSWPRMTPGTILPATMGIAGIDGISPDGAEVAVHQNPRTGGVADLFLLNTSTTSPQRPITLSSAATAVPGQDLFSADSGYVFWIRNADRNGVGEIMSRKVDGSMEANPLGTMGWRVYRYSDPMSALMFVNLTVAPLTMMTGRPVADIAVRRRDGSMPVNLLVSSFDARTFLLFPRTKSKIVYRIIDPPNPPGLYVRDLPPG
jgi:hypothetical protein